MLVVGLLVIVQLACGLSIPLFFRGATQPRPELAYLRNLSPEAKSTKEYQDTEKSMRKVWQDNEKIRTVLGSQLSDAKEPSGQGLSIRTPIQHSGDAKKNSPPDGIPCGIFACHSNLIPRPWYERARRKRILDDEVELVRLLTQAYHTLKDGNVAAARKLVSRAERIQAKLKLLEPNLPSIHLLENDRYRRSLEKLTHAQKCFSGLLARVKLTEAMQKLAENRIAIAQRWSKPRVALEDTAPEILSKKIMNWLSGSRKKHMAIQAAIRAARREIMAARARRRGDYVEARRNISKAQRLQAEAERLRAQIPQASEAIISLLDVPEYRITTKPLRTPYIIDQIMQSRQNLGFELIKGRPRGLGMDPVGQDLLEEGWLTRFAMWLLSRT